MNCRTSLLYIVIILHACVSCRKRFNTFKARHYLHTTDELRCNHTYKTLYITQFVDHFGFNNRDTYQQRYLLASQYWNHNGGLILFYTGNEGDITWFCNNTGFMWDIAPEFRAMLVFAEHRYYGNSLPFGSKSYKSSSQLPVDKRCVHRSDNWVVDESKCIWSLSPLNPLFKRNSFEEVVDLPTIGFRCKKNSSTLNYLTAEQAMADFAMLIKFIKQTTPGANSSPVITIGGSYGGMLAAWMRMKYPNLVVGALAASAPLLYFHGIVPCNVFYDAVQATFQNSSQTCAKNIGRAWDSLSQFSDDLPHLTDIFALCRPLQTSNDLAALYDWIAEVLVDLAMCDYPYPASFMESLPGWPVKAFCQFLSQPLHGQALVGAIANGVKMYFNHTGQIKCLNLSQEAAGGLGDMGWSYQTCTEMVMPMCAKNSMFYNIDWNFTAFTQQCERSWGVRPREDWAELQFWGRNIHSSNIIFSNGMLDPWSSGGILQSLSETLIAIKIPNGAHHLDLRGTHHFDTPDVTAARKLEKSILRRWISGA